MLLKLIFFVTLGLLAQINLAHATEYTVIGIKDGDTIEVIANSNRLTVRLAEIDAPESGQPYGKRSKDSLAKLIFRKKVALDISDTDRYGRSIATIYLDDLNINKEQVRRGMAWAYKKYLIDKSYLDLEASAKSQQIGLWQEPNPVPPWEWRHTGGINSGRSIVEDQPSEGINLGASKFQCGLKTFCRQMASCEEARYFLAKCGISKLDGDGDGVPCEKLCR